MEYNEKATTDILSCPQFFVIGGLVFSIEVSLYRLTVNKISLIPSSLQLQDL